MLSLLDGALRPLNVPLFKIVKPAAEVAADFKKSRRCMEAPAEHPIGSSGPLKDTRPRSEAQFVAGGAEGVDDGGADGGQILARKSAVGRGEGDTVGEALAVVGQGLAAVGVEVLDTLAAGAGGGEDAPAQEA